MKKIIGDPGHGDHDNGANGYGLLEKELTLDRVKRMKEIMESEYEDVEFILTRSDDTFLELTERADIANKAGADVFISDHKNAFNEQARGFETYIFNGGVGAATRSLQNIMHRKVYSKIEKYGIPDRGTKQANYSVLRNTRMSAILLEEAFIDNKADNNLLRKKEFKEDYCRGVVEALAEFLGLKKKKDVKSVATHEPSKTHEANWKWATEKGLFNGKDPKEPITREQMATVLKRYDDMK